MRAGDRLKTDRLDAIRLARLFRAGELTPIWVPNETYEGMRDLFRARESDAEDQRHKRQLASALMLRHGRVFLRNRSWTVRYRRWLQSQSFNHPAHQIALQEMRQAEQNATEGHDWPTGHIEALLPDWKGSGSCAGSVIRSGIILDLLCRFFIDTASPEPQGRENTMEIIKRGNGNQRGAQTQGRTHCRIKHPCRCHDRDTGIALQSYIVHHRVDGIETHGHLNQNRNAICNAHGKSARRGQNERELAIGRKNALFAGHDAGAQKWDTTASLIEICKLNEIDLHDYLSDVLTAIVGGHKRTNINELLPWNYPKPV